MPRKATKPFEEKELSKGQARKLKALRKSVGEDIGNKAFAEWLSSQQDGGASVQVDPTAARIAAAIEDLIRQTKLSIPRGGYLVRRGRGRVIVTRPEAGQT